jgi:uncharacterized protein YceH (UPF0502 family)
MTESAPDSTLPPLDEVSVRILGALIEKELTTPDYYPLTLNALTAACNQTSNRDPVMSLDETAVQSGIDELAGLNLVRQVYKSESRAKRYRHTLGETLHLHPAEIAVMCVLMLRGPQTAGEIRTRSGRLFEFRDVPHVEVTLQVLMTMSSPLVSQLPRRPGQKEVRYAQLLGGDIGQDVDAVGEPAAATKAPTRDDRITELERTVESLTTELDELKGKFERFLQQFQ